MKCPRTGSNLKPLSVGGIEVDVSELCGGVFFDNLELKQFEKHRSHVGDILVEHLEKFQHQKTPTKERVNCPRCPDVVMMRRFYDATARLEIDECPNCGGIWLDTGELDIIRKTYLSQVERDEMTNRMITEIENDPRYANEQKLRDIEVEKLSSVSSFFWNIIIGKR